MSDAHGQWLRQQRQARGWNVPKMGRKLREAAESAGDTLPANDGLAIMINRWEDDRSGISERYRLHYCRAFQIPADSYGDPATLTAQHANGSARRDNGQTSGEQLDSDYEQPVLAILDRHTGSAVAWACGHVRSSAGSTGRAS